MSDTLLPNSVQTPHIIAFDLLMKQRLDAIHLDELLIYMIDSVDKKALYWLAEQFDLLGHNGWRLADTEEKKRDLIKKGIELHRYKGTVWAIKEALSTVGFPDATITEHVQHWAGFTIQLNVGDETIDQSRIDNALKMVKAYKNVRSHLKGFEFSIVINGDLTLTDESYEAQGTQYGDNIFTGGDFLYNGEYTHDGTKNYSSDSDLLELNIIQ